MGMDLNISLSPSILQILENKVAAGLYNSLNDAINATLSSVMTDEIIRKERIKMLNAEIQKGLDDVKAGRVSDGMAFIDDLIAEYED